MKYIILSFLVLCMSSVYASEILTSIPQNSIRNGTLQDGVYQFINVENGKAIKVALENIKTNEDLSQASLDIMIRKNGASFGCRIQTLGGQNNALGCKVTSMDKKIFLTVILQDFSQAEHDKHYLLNVKFSARAGKFHPAVRDNFSSKITAE